MCIESLPSEAIPARPMAVTDVVLELTEEVHGQSSWLALLCFASFDVAQEPCRRARAVDIGISAHLPFARLLRKNITYCGLSCQEVR